MQYEVLVWILRHSYSRVPKWGFRKRNWLILFSLKSQEWRKSQVQIGNWSKVRKKYARIPFWLQRNGRVGYGIWDMGYARLFLVAFSLNLYFCDNKGHGLLACGVASLAWRLNKIKIDCHSPRNPVQILIVVLSTLLFYPAVDCGNEAQSTANSSSWFPALTCLSRIKSQEENMPMSDVNIIMNQRYRTELKKECLIATIMIILYYFQR